MRKTSVVQLDWTSLDLAKVGDSGFESVIRLDCESLELRRVIGRSSSRSYGWIGRRWYWRSQVRVIRTDRMDVVGLGEANSVGVRAGRTDGLKSSVRPRHLTFQLYVHPGMGAWDKTNRHCVPVTRDVSNSTMAIGIALAVSASTEVGAQIERAAVHELFDSVGESIGTTIGNPVGEVLHQHYHSSSRRRINLAMLPCKHVINNV
jgi:hypothetical protein